MGYYFTQKGYKLLDLQSGHIFVNRNVIFFERILSFASNDLFVPSLFPNHVYYTKIHFVIQHEHTDFDNPSEQDILIQNEHQQHLP